jgi:peptidoglycan/LPS O-acetylase OafA/YrhL
MAMSYFFDHDQKHYFFFHTPVFMLGVVLFLYHVKKITTWELAVFTFYAMWLTYYEITPACVVAALGTGIFIYGFHFRSKFLEWTGDVSYSLYLTHAFSGGQFLYYTAHFATDIWQKVGLIMAAVLISIGFAYIFYRIIEVPSVRWSQRIKYKGKG